MTALVKKRVEINSRFYVALIIGNNRSALNDATVAWKLQPTYMKAIIRGRY